MPFDGREQEYARRLKMVRAIDRVIEQLSSEESWAKGALYVEGGQRCILGAMQTADAQHLKLPILQAIRQVTGRHYPTIEDFNDRRTTSYVLMRAALDRARQNILDGTAEFVILPKPSFWQTLFSFN